MRVLLPIFRIFTVAVALTGLLAPAAAQQLPPDTLLRETFRTAEGNWPVEQTNNRLCERTNEGYPNKARNRRVEFVVLSR